MKKIKSQKDIPWFKIENYDYIHNLGESDILLELEIRRDILLGNTSIDEFFYSQQCEFIFNGDPQIKLTDSERGIEFDHVEEVPGVIPEFFSSTGFYFQNVLNFGSAVMPTSIFETLKNHRWLLENNYYDGDETSLEDSKSTSLLSSISLLKPNGEISCSLDLQNYTDEEILQSIKNQLPGWRTNILKIPEPNKRFIKDAEIKKIKDYKIIPIFDLMIWELHENLTISKRVIASCVEFHLNGLDSADLAGGNAKVSKLIKTILHTNFSIDKAIGIL